MAAPARSLATIIDHHVSIGTYDDKAFREYRLALRQLRESMIGYDDGPDSFDQFLADLGSDTSMGDPEDA